MRHPFFIRPRVPALGCPPRVVVRRAGRPRLAAQQAHAAGFAIKEQSGAALGNAFAGATAGAEDLSDMFFNSAAMARRSGSRVLAAASYVAPQSELQTGTARTTALAGSVPITGGLGGGDISDDALMPAFYATYEVEGDLKVGLGVNVPFGLVTEYEAGWIGRYHALRSELRAININPAVAYRPSNWLSLGVDLQVQHIEVELSNAVDFGSIDIGSFGNAFSGTATQDDGRSKVEGDDWGFGYNLGILIEPLEGTRVGAAYRSKVSHEVEGAAAFDLGGPVGTGISNASGQFVDTGAAASASLPGAVSFGFHHEIAETLAVMGEAAWTRWSGLRELRIRFDNPAQPDNVIALRWDDSWFLAGGAAYRFDEHWSLRAGVAYEQTPIPDQTRSPRIPGEDRVWLAMGASYRPTRTLKVDFGYTHIFVDDATLDLTTGGAGNTFRGNRSGRYEGSIDIATIQARYLV